VSGEKDEAEPVTFDEVFDAVTPPLAPGASKADLLASLRHATRTGGHIPGGIAPDISMPVVTDLSGNGVHPAVMEALRAGATSAPDLGAALAAHQERQRALEAPAAVSEEGAALAAMYHDLIVSGIPLSSVERILGAMLATLGVMGEEDGK
jgi:hypothetical protein